MLGLPTVRLLMSVYRFFAHPLRGLNEKFDPSKATSVRPRKLGLRPQTVSGALLDASLDFDGCLKIFTCTQRLRVLGRECRV